MNKEEKKKKDESKNEKRIKEQKSNNVKFLRNEREKG